MNAKSTCWQRRILHGLTVLAILAVAFGVPAPALAAIPSNDDFNTPVSIAVTPAVIYMNDTDFNDSTVAFDDPIIDCNGGPGLRSIWYTFVPTAYGQATIDTFGSQFDTVLAVWTGERGSLQAVGCNDDAANPGIYNNSEIKLNLRPGVRYYIEVAQFTGAAANPLKSFTTDAVTDASSTWLTLNVKFASSPVVTAGMYDNKDSVWSYVGSWTVVTGTPYYLGSIHRAGLVGANANLNFDGDQFTLYFTRGTAYGRLEVWLDGVLLTTINQYGLTAYQQTYVSPVLTNGVHTLQFKDVYRYVNIDAILITAPPDAFAPDPVLDLAAAPGATFGNVDLTWTATGDDGSDGMAKSYLVRRAASEILTETDWNNATPVTTGVPAPGLPGSSQSMTVTGLTPGLTYYFAIRVLDEGGNQSSLSNSPVAQAGFSGSVPTAPGIYDNKHANWMFFGTWATALSPSAYGGNYRYSSTIGNSSAFVFTGVKFTFIYGMNRYNGNLDIYVDDVFVYRLNQNSTTQKWQQKYTGPTLSAGQHTVRFVHATGARVEVDAIEIVGSADVDPPDPITNLAAVPNPLTNGSINLTWTSVAEDSIPNTGTASAYLVRYSVNDITDEATWDAATPVTTGIPAPKAPGYAEAMTVNNLMPGVTYYLAVRAVDDFGNLGGFPDDIVSASAVAKSPTPVGAGKYDNKDTVHILYTTWSLLSFQTGAYLSSVHYSTIAGKTATLVFTGTDFSLIYTRDTVYGVVEVYVDGLLVGTITQTGTRAWQQVWRYTDHFAPLSAGQHTVQFRHLSGSRANVDAIEIFP